MVLDYFQLYFQNISVTHEFYSFYVPKSLYYVFACFI